MPLLCFMFHQAPSLALFVDKVATGKKMLQMCGKRRVPKLVDYGFICMVSTTDSIEVYREKVLGLIDLN